MSQRVELHLKCCSMYLVNYETMFSVLDDKSLLVVDLSRVASRAISCLRMHVGLFTTFQNVIPT